jgi:hypothetical protein
MLVYIPKHCCSPRRDEEETDESPSYKIENYFRLLELDSINWERTLADYDTAPDETVRGALAHMRLMYETHQQIPRALGTSIRIGLDLGEPIPPEEDAEADPQTERNLPKSSSSAVVAVQAAAAEQNTFGRQRKKRSAFGEEENSKPTKSKRVRYAASGTEGEADDEAVGGGDDTDGEGLFGRNIIRRPKVKNTKRVSKAVPSRPVQTIAVQPTPAKPPSNNLSQVPPNRQGVSVQRPSDPRRQQEVSSSTIDARPPPAAKAPRLTAVPPVQPEYVPHRPTTSSTSMADAFRQSPAPLRREEIQQLIRSEFKDVMQEMMARSVAGMESRMAVSHADLARALREHADRIAAAGFNMMETVLCNQVNMHQRLFETTCHRIEKVERMVEEMAAIVRERVMTDSDVPHMSARQVTAVVNLYTEMFTGIHRVREMHSFTPSYSSFPPNHNYNNRIWGCRRDHSCLLHSHFARMQCLRQESWSFRPTRRRHPSHPAIEEKRCRPLQVLPHPFPRPAALARVAL